MEILKNNRQKIYHTILSLPLRFKISIPYLIVASLFAGLATYMVGRSLVATLEDRFRNQLEDASYRAIENSIGIESEQLQIFRTIAYTMRFPEAVADGDQDQLAEIIFPIIVNTQLDFVEVLDVKGNLLASWHRTAGTSEYRRTETGDYLAWAGVQSILDGQSDDIGDKFIDFVDTPWGLVLYTVGPIQTESGLLGVLLIGTPVDAIIRNLSLASLANVSLYAGDGSPINSSFDIDHLVPIDQDLQDNLPGIGKSLLTRNLAINQKNYVEAVETLYLRGEPSDWIIGVALAESLVRENQGSTAWQLLGTFFVGILALIGLGVVVAQMVSRPVSRLVFASQEVGTGNLDVQVEVESDDEIGVLADGFNSMVAGLRQREFIREMFGRMVSEDVREAVLHDQLKLGGEAHDVTVLFTDVRGFTTLTEAEPPEVVISLLNEFFNIVNTATHKYQGTINHFGGDSVLVVFGAPINRSVEETVLQAVHAAIEIYQNVIELNAKRIAGDSLPVRFGIGINSGSVVAGNIGSLDRFTYTVIGDVVNVAARLQGLSREFPVTPLLIPKACIEMAKDYSAIGLNYLSDFSLKGKSIPIPTYAILGSNEFIPSEFNVFSKSIYSDHIALLACNLHCLGYETSIIASAMQIDPIIIEKWIAEAGENAAIVAEIMIKKFNLDQDAIQKLDK